ncbi:MASE1 domain-containing protein [Myxococcus sp. RHSTA-1-4]|uniref:sensor histidine kinase n=1 Tax=Myxococcus sp. RHSTA-1-4 TaxID=2874601 RepID=UPI001CC131FD|nr:MASE1 domain-containing protein [Myxococcus sp. RHSTA-1-4]MBZ4418076.1 MASE1 domain-containing protein [Myxococcus sp. RHSTA-1-4]
MARRAMLLAVCYLALKLVSMHFVYAPLSSALVWLPAGLSLAFLLRSPQRMWPALLGAVFVAEAGSAVAQGFPAPVAVAWGLGNILRPLLGAVLLGRFVGGPVRFLQVRDVAGLLVLAGLVGTVPGATLGAGAAALWLRTAPFWDEWWPWWLSDCLGTVLVAPVLLTWWPLGRRPLGRRRLLEMGVLLALVAGVTVFIFHRPSTSGIGFTATLPYAAFPFVIAAALRLGPRGASSTSAVMGTLAVAYTSRDYGLFSMLPVSTAERVLSVQVFLAVLTLTALTLAAVVAGRRRAEMAKRVLAGAGAVLAESPDWSVTLPRVARLLVPELCVGTAIWMVDTTGMVERVASAGWTPEREAGLRGHFPPLPRGPLKWRGAGGSGVLVPLRVRGQVVGALSLVADEDGHPVCRRDVLLAEDLARRCSMALENARLLDEAHEAIRVRDEFIAVAAHELRTPLATLTLRVQSLMGQLRRGGGGEDVLEKLGFISRQVTRLTELVETVLDVGRVNAGTLELRREEVDLSALVEEGVGRFADEAARAGCELRLRMEPPHVWGWLDRGRMEQALNHLLGNAIKFGIGHPVDVELTEVDGRARLTVTDQGIGIPRDSLERIFGRFERAVSSLQYGGLGLGLFLTRQIAEAHGGSVHVESEAGAGATFVLELPVRPRAPLPHEAPRPQPGA